MVGDHLSKEFLVHSETLLGFFEVALALEESASRLLCVPLAGKETASGLLDITLAQKDDRPRVPD